MPGLSLTAEPKSVTAGDTAVTTIVFRVSDAGEPVSGATVTFGGQSVTSDTSGRVSFPFRANTPPGRLSGRAAATGYVRASATVTVEAPKPQQR